MNAFQDTTVVIAGTVVATGLTVLNDLLNGRLSMRPIIGGFIIGTSLLIMAFFNTSIAAAISLLLLTTSLFMNGVPVLTKVMTYGTGN